MALETVESPQDLATLPEKSKEDGEECDQIAEEQADEPPRPVRMLSRERRSLSRHSSGNFGPGMLSRERNRVPSRSHSMRIVRPLVTGNSDTFESGSGLSREKGPSSPRRSMGGRPSRSSSMRGLGRTKSMADGPLTRSLARNNSMRAEPTRRVVGRTKSQQSLAHMASESTLRPYRGHDKVVNQSIRSSDRPSLRRSPEDRSSSDISSFTAVDPIDDQTYRETDSIADHDTCVSGEYGDYTEFLPENDPNRVPYDGASLADATLCTFDSVQLRRKQIMATNSNHSFDASSFSTFNSGDMNLGGEVDEFAGETAYFDEFYLDTSHVVEEEDAEDDAENSDSSDEETIEGEESDNEEVEDDEDSGDEDSGDEDEDD